MPLVTLLYIGVNVSYLTVLSPTQIFTSAAVAVVSCLKKLYISFTTNSEYEYNYNTYKLLSELEKCEKNSRTGTF